MTTKTTSSNSCAHPAKVCKQLKWGTFTFELRGPAGRIYTGSANVDLWYCPACEQSLLHNWHDDSYSPLK